MQKTKSQQQKGLTEVSWVDVLTSGKWTNDLEE